MEVTTGTEPVSLSNWQLIREVFARATASAKGFSKLRWLGTVLGSAAAAYVLGGAVLALRLDRADFPVEGGLNVIPFSAMLITGVRELVITVFVGVVLVSVVLLLGFLFRWIPGISEELVIGLVAVLLLAFVPLNAGGLAWPVALFVLGGGLFAAKRRRREEPDWLPSLTVAVVILLLTVSAVTLLRYTSPPYRFQVASVLLKPVQGVSNKAWQSGGGYLGETPDYVYLAWRDNPKTSEEDSQIVAFAREDVLELRLSPPPPPVSSPSSIVNVLFGLNVSITPMGDVWSNGQYHGWRLVR
jgi:hypothetical protein